MTQFIQQDIKKIVAQGLTLLLLLALCITASAANLSASVDRDTLGLEETFTLTLRYDEQVNAVPDYDLLQRDFDILNTQSGTQMTIINGRAEAYTDWKIALAPRRIGKALIPSFNINGSVSDAIEITVEGKSRAPKNGGNDVSVELEPNKETAYVQEQVVVTIRLFTSVDLNRVELQPLQVKDALVVLLDEKQYKTKIAGRPGLVVETSYALFPQQSGELIIPSLLYQVVVNNNQNDLWSQMYGNRNGNVLRLRTEEQRLTINPAPVQANGKPWIPAENLALVDHWSADINSLKIGEPVTRTITVTAHGLTAGQINPLQLPNVDGLTFYQDQAQNDDQKSPKGVVGAHKETIAIVPTRSGTFTLPEVKVSWWDTVNNQFQTATLPAVTLNVIGGVTPLVPAQPSVPAAENETTTDTQTPTIIAKTETVPAWLYVTNLLALILACIFAALYWKNKRTPTALATNSNNEQKAQAEADAWSQLKRRLSEKDLIGLRNALVTWSQVYWRDVHIINLQDISNKAKDAALTRQLNTLDAEIYSGKQQNFDTSELLRMLANLRHQKNNKTGSSGELPPLYKN